MGLRALLALFAVSACVGQASAQGTDAGTVLEFRSVAPPPAAPLPSPVRSNVLPAIQIRPTSAPVGRRFGQEESDIEPGVPPRPRPVVPPSETNAPPIDPTYVPPSSAPEFVPTTEERVNGEWPTSPVSVRPAPTPFWLSADYLLARIQPTSLPVLATTSPIGTPRALAGVMGQPTTNSLVSGTPSTGPRSGFKIDGGMWFPSRDGREDLGVEAGFSMIEGQSALYSLQSNGSTILARPFFNVNTNSGQAVLVAFPGVSAGRIDITAQSNNFYEVHAALVERSFEEGFISADSILGWRFYRYDERLTVQQTTIPTKAAFIAGTQVLSLDDFRARDEFNGLDMGLRFRFRLPQDLTLTVLGKLAVGRVDREGTIQGSQTTIVPGQAILSQPGGVLALPSNISSHGVTDWAIMPEAGVSLAWQASPSLRLRVGYNITMLQGITRATGLVDTRLNPNLFPPSTGVGLAIPAPSLRREDVLLQSVQFGLEYEF